MTDSGILICTSLAVGKDIVGGRFLEKKKKKQICLNIE